MRQKTSAQKTAAPVGDSVIACPCCGKMMRMLSRPTDASGETAMIFSATCIRCGRASRYSIEDVRKFPRLRAS